MDMEVSPAKFGTEILQNMNQPQGAEERHHQDTHKTPIQQAAPDHETLYHPFQNSPIRVALKALVDMNISLVEYGTQVQFRYGYEEIPVVVEWAVPDEELSLASQILVENDFPLLSTGRRLWLGYWETKCLRHDLDGAGWRCVHLLPLSLVGFALDDTIKVTSMFAPEISILTPKPPRYMLSLINHLRKLRIHDSSRLRVEKDLLTFISSYILHGPPGDISPEARQRLIDEQSEEGLQKKLDEGVRFMREWDWGDVEEADLALAERVIGDCQYVGKLADVTQEPSSP
ncbi:uncharacterized protein N7459_008002 [Penicillium hispanicum]|uniref:uncharacterized protein n=1 Tax=Penicillium hispanicum TaxID=1080232 RepID=UPI00253FC421|nr:uncharacterized protein N7459_008002 [Penicillium hispanicum]KAJ5573575.1 hypothetical protein N7459_008002 [Penicillium hispanicum]